jgi:hypothetical protein
VVEAGPQDEDAVADDEVTRRCSSLNRRDQAPARMWRSGSGLPMQVDRSRNALSIRRLIVESGPVGASQYVVLAISAA